MILADEQLTGATGPGGELLAGNVLWALTDHLGSVRDLVAFEDTNNDTIKDTAVVKNHIKYNAFGNIKSEKDEFGNAPTVDHIFGFTARERDKESDLYYYRNRYYDPTTGRFLTADPIRDDFENTYRYVNNDPVNRIDPSGLRDKSGTFERVYRRGDAVRYHSDIHRPRVNYRRFTGLRMTIGRHYKVGGSPMIELEGSKRKFHTTPHGLKLLMKYRFIRGMTHEKVTASIDKYAPLVESPRNIKKGSKFVGVFFDGTSNHLGHITNIIKMYSGYLGSKHYFGGVGNYVDFGERNTSGGAGRGFSPLVRRALGELINNYGGLEGLRKKKIHIFGFSRGAAQAVELAKVLEGLNVEVDFLMPFDPVHSVFKPGQDSSYVKSTPAGVNGNYVTTTFPTNVRKALPFYAKHEQRSWFTPTVFTNTANIAGYQSYLFPGTHGDIGGHYQSNPHIQRITFSAALYGHNGYLQPYFNFDKIDPVIHNILTHPELPNLMKNEDSGYEAKSFKRIRNEIETHFKPWNQKEFIFNANRWTKDLWGIGPTGVQTPGKGLNLTNYNIAHGIFNSGVGRLLLGQSNQPWSDMYKRSLLNADTKIRYFTFMSPVKIHFFDRNSDFHPMPEFD